MVIKQFLNEVKSLKKETAYDYDYRYYNIDEEGRLVEYKLEDSSRKTYEKFKTGKSVGYSGKVSLREVEVDGVLVGYVAEAKKPTYPHKEKAKEIYEEAFSSFVKEYNVKDVEMLKWYMVQNVPQLEWWEGFESTISEIKFLAEIEEEMDADEDFQRFFKKMFS